MTENRDPDFARQLPGFSPARVHNCEVYDLDGPYTTKTGSSLYVGWAFPLVNPSYSRTERMPALSSSLPANLTLEEFLSIVPSEEERLVRAIQEKHPDFNLNIQGDRLYFQTGMQPQETSAGQEFHRIRREWMSVPIGHLEMTLEDIYGGTDKVDLVPGKAVIIEPFIMHSLLIRKPSCLLIRANTLFNFWLSNPTRKIAVPDSYSRETFEGLKRRWMMIEKS